jgi:hypothetical protein
MAADFLAQVEQLFGFLSGAGFEVGDRTVAASFDNAYVSFRSAGLLAGIGRDRGQSYVEVGAPGKSRYDGHLLAAFVGDEEGMRVAALEHPRVAELAAFVERHLPALVTAFAPARRDETVRALGRLVNRAPTSCLAFRVRRPSPFSRSASIPQD